MKITEVEALYLRLPEIQARTDSSQDALIVKVSTDAGITGWGEVDGCPYVDQGDHRGADVAHPGHRPARSCCSARTRSRSAGCGARCTRARSTTGARAR